MKKPDAVLHLEEQGMMFSITDGALVIKDEGWTYYLSTKQTFQLTELLVEDACRRNVNRPDWGFQ